MSFLDSDGSVTELKTGELKVGSGKEASLRLQQMDLAPHHLTLMTAEDGATVVRPYGAHLIVTVNGRRITEPTRLSDGDLIGAGAARLRYQSTPAAATAPRQNESAWLLSESDNCAYSIARRAITIGRDAASTIQIRDPDISRQHADIVGEAGLHLLHSLRPTGTKVNGQVVTSSRILEEGDVIEIGEARLRYTRVPPSEGMRISSGGEEYDLEVSSEPTGRQLRITQKPGKALNSPKVLRVVAIVVALMALAVIVLLFIV